ncbi:MAG: hypothetical protein H7Y88_00250 [Phycisphaerales bacterium]|nr:hypothetical protein [Phycisphaerales bacterium]
MGDTKGSRQMNMNAANVARRTTSAKRNQPSDSPGASSSHSRSTKSGAEHSGSSSSGQGGAGAPSGSGTSNPPDKVPGGSRRRSNDS